MEVHIYQEAFFLCNAGIAWHQDMLDVNDRYPNILLFNHARFDRKNLPFLSLQRIQCFECFVWDP